jgi:hypothetical protein
VTHTPQSRTRDSSVTLAAAAEELNEAGRVTVLAAAGARRRAGVLSGRGDEVLEVAKTNLRELPLA